VLGTVQVTLIAAITIVTVALPAIGADLHLDEPGLVLVSSAYGISFGGLLLLGGRLADRFGLRRAFAAGTIIFGAGSAGAGLAPSAALLIAARLAQGAGAALAAPAAVALLGTLYPDQGRRQRAMALWGVLSSTGAITGTVLSGVLITWISWRWAIAAPAAIAVAAAVLAPRVLPGPPPLPRQVIGWPGAVLATAGLATLIYGLQRSGWAVIAGAALLVLLGLAERRSAAPLIPMRLLSRQARPLAAVLACAATMAASFFMLSLYLQQVRGLSALQTSAVFLLAAPAAIAGGPLAAALIRRFGVRPVLAAGVLTAAAGVLLLSFLSIPYPGLVLVPLGADLTFSAATVASMLNTGQAQAGLAGALVAAATETGPPLGLAALSWIAAAWSGQLADGYPFALRMAAVALAVLFAVLAIRPPSFIRQRRLIRQRRNSPEENTHAPAIHQQGRPDYRWRLGHRARRGGGVRPRGRHRGGRRPASGAAGGDRAADLRRRRPGQRDHRRCQPRGRRREAGRDHGAPPRRAAYRVQ
jgi:MFS family permease